MDERLVNRVLDLAVAIQQIPAPTFAERARAEFVQGLFLKEELSQVCMDEVNNVMGCWKGAGDAPPLVVSAHLDTVFPLGTDLSIQRSPGKIHGPGVGDNSMGVAGLMGLLWALRQEMGNKSPFPGDLWLVGNMGEEGLGDLQGMRALVDRFGEAVLAYLILEGMALGQVYHRGLAVRRYRISVRTPGGHSWVDFGQPSAIHELGELIIRLTALPLPARPRTTLNVGVISGGTTVNTIASRACLELDLRSESAQTLEMLSGRVENLLKANHRAEVEIHYEIIGQRPGGKLAANHPLVELARRALATQGVSPSLGIGSTDANVPLSRGIPAVCVGLTTGGNAHTTHEYIHTAPVTQGLGQLAVFVKEAFTRLA